MRRQLQCANFSPNTVHFSSPTRCSDGRQTVPRCTISYKHCAFCPSWKVLRYCSPSKTLYTALHGSLIILGLRGGPGSGSPDSLFRFGPSSRQEERHHRLFNSVILLTLILTLHPRPLPPRSSILPSSYSAYSPAYPRPPPYEFGCHRQVHRSATSPSCRYHR